MPHSKPRRLIWRDVFCFLLGGLFADLFINTLNPVEYKETEESHGVVVPQMAESLTSNKDCEIAGWVLGGMQFWALVLLEVLVLVRGVGEFLRDSPGAGAGAVGR